MASDSAPAQEGTEKKKRKLWILAVLVIIAFLLILAFFPTPHARIGTRSNREGLLNCSNTLKDGWLVHWDLTDLPDDLRIVVDVGSTEEVKIYIRSVEGTVSNDQKKVHDYTVYANGPSLYVEVKNPTLFGLGASAVVSGDIKIYHDYEASHIEWLPWWMS